MKIKSAVISMSMCALLLSACGEKPADTAQAGSANHQGAAPETSTSTDSNTTSGDAAKQETVLTIKTYAADDQVLDLVERSQEIRFTNEEGKYIAALSTLTESDNPSDFPLWKGVDFSSAVLSQGKLTVDVKLEEGPDLGAPGEQLALQAIQKVLFQFNEVQSIDILKEGAAVESLLGHVDLQHPIKRP
ncbi:GerMN domain-containing protein [Paenibacillus gansuensis]|uniref:GerMN domain-containing protein n=1 Tax=Paenibacillus gansuensis TaxID=306542 RepID=A0ABW5PCA6_9BACL